MIAAECPRVNLSVPVDGMQRVNLLWTPRDKHAFGAVVRATISKTPRRKADA